MEEKPAACAAGFFHFVRISKMQMRPKCLYLEEFTKVIIP
jgi:hypothetical protein